VGENGSKKMTYIAFLRGINVSGQKLIKMAELKVMFEKMGYKNVRTFIQSGNVVFEASKTKNESLAAKIEKGLEKLLGYNVSVIVRTPDDIKAIIKAYPFSKIKNHNDFRPHVAFLSAEPDKTAVKELEALSTKDEMFKVAANNVYVILNKGFVDALTGKGILEKKLKVRATVRNWNTVNKILNV
jgi:uncharacterized protein (DUF1697 family)